MKPHATLIFISAVILTLGLLCLIFPKGGITVVGTKIKMPAIADILNDNTAQNELDIEKMDSIKHLKYEQTSAHSHTKDSLIHFAEFITDSSMGFSLPNDDVCFFDKFFAKAEKAASEGKVVRILHYGDSQIEMDRISDILRAYMQKTFGGLGVGLIPFSQTIPSLSVKQYATGDFTHYSSYGSEDIPRNRGHYGPMAKCCRVNSTATANISAATSDTRDGHLKSFSKITLLFDNLNGNLTATLSANGHSERKYSATRGVNTLTWQLDTAVTSVSLTVSGLSDIYGIMVDGSSGVSVDNISMRGASGHQIRMIDSILLAQSYAKMNIGLIIFQYGGNSVPYLTSQASRDNYAEAMAKQLQRLHNTCPNAQILFIGPADMCKMVNGNMQSYPYMQEVVNTLRSMALENNVAFWSMYDVMGGYNSMLTWKKNGLGGGDYVHFSQKGADKMASYLVNAFQTMYELYLFHKDTDPAKFNKLWTENTKQQ
ncbi:MAG: hypothetical protein J5605_05595 [Bacteroidales bacterium]|nr:hypothetical protein [Bacteroidales bacterium]